MSEPENSAAGADPAKDDNQTVAEPAKPVASSDAPSETKTQGVSEGDGAPEGEAAKSDSAGAEGTVEKKKKKKKKKKVEEAPAETGPALDAEGRERPAFVLTFPSHPELDRLVRAFELGNYAYVREHAPKLTENDHDKDVREAASDLLRRIEPDPLVKVLLAMSVLLLFVITFWAYRTHGH